jgi:hypothetical protein
MRQDEDLAAVPVLLLTGTSLAQDVARQRANRMTIRRPDGLGLPETLECLRAVIQVLEPRYDERFLPEELAAEPGA